MNDKQETNYDAELYEAYAYYVEKYEEKSADYETDKREYEEGNLAEKPVRNDYYPDGEDYFSTQLARFLAFLPNSTEFDDIIDKAANGETLNKHDEEIIQSYLKNMKQMVQNADTHAAKLIDELAIAIKNEHLIDDAVGKIRKLRLAEKELYKHAKKYITEHKEEYETENKNGNISETDSVHKHQKKEAFQPTLAEDNRNFEHHFPKTVNSIKKIQEMNKKDLIKTMKEDSARAKNKSNDNTQSNNFQNNSYKQSHFLKMRRYQND